MTRIDTRPGVRWPQPPYTADLEKELVAQLKGEVRFDRGSRSLYATDASNYRQVPIGVVIPKCEEDVTATLAACGRYGAPVLARGGGTSLAGQCCNVAVVMDFSKYMHQILELDAAGGYAWVQPGCVLDHLRDAASPSHLTFAPDPSTHTHNTLGGMIGNNSCGVHSVMGGKTSDNILALDIVTYDGCRMTVGPVDDSRYAEIQSQGGRPAQIYAALKKLSEQYADQIRARFPKIPRRVSGYNLDELLPENGFNIARALVGSEGTCVTVLRAKVRLIHSPPFRTLLVLGYPDVFHAADHIMEVLAFGPIGLEGIDNRLIADMKAVHLHPHDVELLPPGRGWLMVEFGGETRQEADDKAHQLAAHLKSQPHPPSMKRFDDPVEEKLIWTVREAGLGATAHVPNKPITWEGWEDAAVPPERLGEYLRKFRRLLDHYGYEGDLYGHFGQGCVHTRIDFDLETEAGIEHYHRFIEDAADLVVKYGGSLSGEHGDGQSRAELLPKMFGAELVGAFREFKAIWDPNNRMNPGKVVDAHGATDDLRLGLNYNPPSVQTHFHYGRDSGNFARTVLRCVGVGNCRRESGGLMCPSYQVTREERHSTRGRARMLFEMMQGEVVQGGWRSPEVMEALHLCLSCKGCKGDCPVNVDMATYKAEFTAHYYKGRIRPRSAYAMGLIDAWARLASPCAAAVNALTHTPGLSHALKFCGGIAQEREIPKFAVPSFRSWMTHRPRRSARGPDVLLWPDTFTNYFLPSTAQSAVHVLENAGFNVRIPPRPLCCGRPLYDIGMLDLAKRYWKKTLDSLAEDIRRGTPIVGMEPACVSAFRDELPNLFPFDEQAHRLSAQTRLFSEFLSEADLVWPRLDQSALVHFHCHHRAVLGTAAEINLLDALQLDYRLAPASCCGMAGSFGFEIDKFQVSKDIAERNLLPAIERCPPDVLIVADGFSCREQIRQLTGRSALHLADLMAMAITRDQARP